MVRIVAARAGGVRVACTLVLHLRHELARVCAVAARGARALLGPLERVQLGVVRLAVALPLNKLLWRRSSEIVCIEALCTAVSWRHARRRRDRRRRALRAGRRRVRAALPVDRIGRAGTVRRQQAWLLCAAMRLRRKGISRGGPGRGQRSCKDVGGGQRSEGRVDWQTDRSHVRLQLQAAQQT
jgi:hypothetical protein